MISKDDRELRRQIISMWEHGLDTRAMSVVLHRPEAEVERELHAAREIRRGMSKLKEAK